MIVLFFCFLLLFLPFFNAIFRKLKVSPYWFRISGHCTRVSKLGWLHTTAMTRFLFGWTPFGSEKEALLSFRNKMKCSLLDDTVFSVQWVSLKEIISLIHGCELICSSSFACFLARGPGESHPDTSINSRC